MDSRPEEFEFLDTEKAQEEPTERQETLGVASLLNSAMARLWDNIDFYSSVIATLASLEGDHETEIEIFNEILQTEQGNVALVQSLADDNLEDVINSNE